MREVGRRQPKVSVALPGSLTLDVPHLREKTSRVGMVARALAMFRVDGAIIYQDRRDDEAVKEASLFEKILRFEETPQYLRKYLFTMDPDLKYAGVLPPLRTAHHPDRENPRTGQLREGVVVSPGPVSTVDAGFNTVVRVNRRLEKLRRVTVRITRASPVLEAELVDASGLHIYWGFRVSRENRLGETIRKGDWDLYISTSRKGEDVRHVMEALRRRWNESKSVLVMFGSPREGIPEILARENVKVSELDFDLNMIPGQGVETVRTEEALTASLGVLNLLEES